MRIERAGRGEDAAAGFPAGRLIRPVVSGELRRHRSGRGRRSPKEVGKASRPLRGKRDPWQAGRTRNNRHPPASARRSLVVSGFRPIGSATSRGGRPGPTLTTRTYSYPLQLLRGVVCHAPELRILYCGRACCCRAARTYSDLLGPTLSERGFRISADGRSHQWAFKSRSKKLERFRQAAPLLQNLDGFLHLSLFCPIRNPGVNEPQRKSKGDDGVDYGRESRSAALSMTSLSMARAFFSSPCLEK